MKLFLASALSLAAAVSFMGSSMPTQAAGQDEVSPSSICEHYWVWTGDSSFSFEEDNSEYHKVSEARTYKCSMCAQYRVEDIGQTGYEKHALRAADWPYRFRCALCGYLE